MIIIDCKKCSCGFQPGPNYFSDENNKREDEPEEIIDETEYLI